MFGGIPVCHWIFFVILRAQKYFSAHSVALVPRLSESIIVCDIRQIKCSKPLNWAKFHCFWHFMSPKNTPYHPPPRGTLWGGVGWGRGGEGGKKEIVVTYKINSNSKIAKYKKCTSQEQLQLDVQNHPFTMVNIVCTPPLPFS